VSLVTLGRSDAILVTQLIERILHSQYLSKPWELNQREDAQDLLEFIKIQLNSIREEEENP